MAVRSIDQKSAFKMNFNISVYLKFEKIREWSLCHVEWFQEGQEGFYCRVAGSFKIDNVTIEKVDKFSASGLTMDTNLNWKKHSQKICNKC